MPAVQEGPRDARIVLVGEAPGENEEIKGRPFIGNAGVYLDKIIDNASRGIMAEGHPPLFRREMFITNVCHKRPPKNKFDWFYQPANQIHYVAGVMRLAKDLTEINPNVVVAFGEHALRALTRKFGITKWRGSILPCTLVPGLKVIGTYHPAAAFHVYEYKAISEFDMQRAGIEQVDRSIVYPERTIYLPDSTTRRVGLEWVDEPDEKSRLILAAEMMNASALGMDIECWQLADGSWTTACIAFSDRPDRAMVLDWSRPVHQEIARRICASEVPKILQNGTFDVTTLRNDGVETRNFHYDTMLAHHALYVESASGADEMSVLKGKKRIAPFKRSLGFQASIYTKEPFYKDDGKLWKKTGDIKTFWRYNALDAAVTREIRDVQMAKIKRRRLQHVLDHEMSLVEPLMAMTATGIRIDMEQRDVLRRKYEQEVNDLTTIITDQAGGSVNVKSPKQMIDLLYTKLGLPVQYKKHKDGHKSPTSDKFAITALAEKHKHPILTAMLRQREKRDFLERYIYAGVDSDNRMRCAIDISGTRTWRLATSRSVTGSGTNLTTIPARRSEGRLIRRMFISDPGKVFLYCDYSQAEARLVANYARCKALIDLFNDPTRDVHSENAHRIFKIPLETVGKDSLERFLAKQGVHAGNYGQGPIDLMRRINAETEVTGISVTLAQCVAIQEAVHGIYPEIKSVFWREVEDELRRSRTLHTPWDFERVFYGRWDDKLIREGYAFKPQAGVGILCCKALVRVYHDIQLGMPELGAQLLLNVYDALLLQCNRDTAFQTAALVKQCMDIPVPVNGVDVRIPVDVKIGLNWDNMGKDGTDNPNGLRDIQKWVA